MTNYESGINYNYATRTTLDADGTQWYQAKCSDPRLQNTICNYEVAATGRIRRIGTNCDRTIDMNQGNKNCKEYITPRIKFMICGKQININLARLMLESLVAIRWTDELTGKPMEPDHLDRNTANNSIDNLKWKTHRENLSNRRSWKWKKNQPTANETAIANRLTSADQILGGND